MENNNNNNKKKTQGIKETPNAKVPDSFLW